MNHDRHFQVDNMTENSFDMDGETFVKGNIAITSTGVFMRDSEKTFNVVYEELDIHETIGRGSSSIVVRAVHRPSGTPLALKIINLFDKSKRDQLIREIKTLYDASCPSLVTFYGAFYRDGGISIALEYMNGGSLTNVIAQVGHIPEAPLANITYQVLWALSYLKHEKRVHRDIKPSNLLINARGQVKVSDFGVSAELQSSIAMCATFVGTFKYMSPERIQSHPYSYASDVWSLGLVLVECATGQYPYGAAPRTCIEMVQTVLETPEPSVSRDVFSSQFRLFLSQCIQRDPARRLPAEILLGAPWLQMHGATSIEAAIANTKQWIEVL